MKLALTFLLALVAAQAVAAEDHLVPEGSPFLDASRARSELAFAQPFETVVSSDAEAWVYGGEGLSPPFVVGVKKHNGARFIFGASPKFGMVQLLQQCELPISWPLAEKIVRMWRNALLQTAADHAPLMGLDGETYHFAIRDGYNWMAGKTWSPQTPKLSRLTNIVSEMRHACESGKPKGLPGLERDIDDLMMRK